MTAGAHANHPILEPGRIGPLRLRNRVVKTATFEGMSPDGAPSDRLLELHRTLARNHVALTTVAYWAVSPDARTFGEQMYARPEVVAPLRRLTDAVHAEGGAASIQLSHCGHFSRNRKLVARGPLGPSFALNRYGLMSGLPFGYAMTQAEMTSTAGDFARAATLAREAGFDAVELHYGHGYLLSQFLSPAANRRRDAYGGSIENRLRFPLMVLRRVREALGAAFPILAKINLRDGFRGGLELDDALEVARALEREGIDAIVMSGGFTAVTPFYLMRGETPLRDMIEVEKSPLHRVALRWFGPRVMRSYPFTEMFFLEEARRMRAAVSVPLVLLGGIVSADNMRQARDERFDFVALGRALIADPDLILRIERGESARTRCIQCNRCVAEIDRDGVRCVLDDARARDGETLP
jgi:2,4-dienoyl-CoA reductase-like NADH-dependent reductase (Old Yellow Enzyme family)